MNRQRHRTCPVLETAECRLLMSATAVGSPATSTAVVGPRSTHRSTMVVLRGTLAGSGEVRDTDVSESDSAQFSGRIPGIGAVRIRMTARSTYIPDAGRGTWSTKGLVTIIGSDGRLDLKIPPYRSAQGGDPIAYVIKGGTGIYRNATGSGFFQLTVGKSVQHDYPRGDNRLRSAEG